jgi:energy-coupling factor transporter ATP-binding protein EcfA2
LNKAEDFTERLALRAKIGSAFSPSGPIDRKSLFAGRLEQLTDGIQAVRQRGQHAVIYGDRGVGKTSFANVLLEIFGDQINKPSCGLINCDGTMTFSSLWHKVFREMPISDHGTLASLLPQTVTPDDIRHVLQNIKDTVIVLDEVDRLSDKSITTQLADTIKNLSDHAIPTTIILVGVAESVDSLIAEHVSIERNLMQIPMPVMSIEELTEVLDNGAKITGLSISVRAKNRIAHLSQGIPYYTHLLGLHAFTNAANRKSAHVEDEDITSSIETALSKATQSIRNGYQTAITSPRKVNLYAQVLLACAMTKPDALGYFYAGDVRAPLEVVMGERYEIAAFSQHLNAFTEKERGPILKRTGKKRKYRFKFESPLMRPYVIMKGLEAGLIRPDQTGKPVS